MDEALGLVGEAIAALGRDDPGMARAAMAEAAGANKSLAAVADAMAFATTELENEGVVSDTAWNALADACPAELRAMVEFHRR